jgi:hypothetical protein
MVALTESMFGMAAPGLVAPLEPSGFITNFTRGVSGSRACWAWAPAVPAKRPTTRALTETAATTPRLLVVGFSMGSPSVDGGAAVDVVRPVTYPRHQV